MLNELKQITSDQKSVSVRTTPERVSKRGLDGKTGRASWKWLKVSNNKQILNSKRSNGETLSFLKRPGQVDVSCILRQYTSRNESGIEKRLKHAS